MKNQIILFFNTYFDTRFSKRNNIDFLALLILITFIIALVAFFTMFILSDSSLFNHTIEEASKVTNINF